MDKASLYWEHLAKALRLEKEADKKHFEERIRSLPIEKRVKEGFSWYPIQVQQSGFAIGDKVFVVVETTSLGANAHFFRSGHPVALFKLSDQGERVYVNGVIHYMDKTKMKIILNAYELPDWIDHKQLGVDPLFDERSYTEMEKTLHSVQKARHNRLADIRDVLIGVQAPSTYVPSINHIAVSGLNDSQNQAVQDIIEAPEVSIVHGPPGTGKTTTLVQAVRLLVQKQHGILVTAASNTAVDVMTERLADAGIHVVRVGHISRVDPALIPLTLDAQVAAHPDAKHIKKVKIEAAAMRQQAKKYKRNFTSSHRTERDHLYQQARELSAWANELEDRLIEQILDSAQVIAATLVGSNHPLVEKRQYPTVVIDEAAQALEPATWIAIQKASKVVLAGDPFQLPPTVKSQEAIKAGLEVTLLEKCVQQLPKVNLLTVQYRMHETIMGFSNQWFYGGQLKADPLVAKHHLGYSNVHPIVFIDTAGCGFEEKINPKHFSRYNPEEFQILCEHLYQLIAHFTVDAMPTIAIISPYKEQVMYMEQAVAEDERLQRLHLRLDTIDGYQGQESEVVYISLVRSNAKSEIGFLKDYRRMNVAMTRAQKLLVVVGDSATLGADPFYGAWLNYVETKEGYSTAWEYMV